VGLLGRRPLAHRLGQLADLLGQPRHRRRYATDLITLAIRPLDQLLQLAQLHRRTVPGTVAAGLRIVVGVTDHVSLAELADEILIAHLPVGVPVRVVAIDGHGGAGKSTLAAKLAEVLAAEVVHTDDFASWDHPLDWWPRLVDDVLEPIRRGQTVLRHERTKWSEEHAPPPVVSQPVTSVVVLEGVSSARQEFRPYLSYAIWVETPKEVCLARGLARDGADMGEQWEDWFAEADAYIARDDPRAYVDRVVPGL